MLALRTKWPDYFQQAAGVKYMFVSNSDNLGATLDIGKLFISFH